MTENKTTIKYTTKFQDCKDCKSCKDTLKSIKDYFKQSLKENPPRMPKHKSMTRQILLGMKLVEIEMKDMSMIDQKLIIDDILITLDLYQIWVKNFC